MIIKDIHIFFNLLRHDGGAIWLEAESIKLSTSAKLQNAETRNFIINNKAQIISILSENNILSKEQFVRASILKSSSLNAYPLSPAQERLWFIEQYEKGTNAYHIPVIFEFDDSVNIKGIKHALRQIVSRHEILRSTIEQGEKEEIAVQHVHEKLLLIEEVKLKNEQEYNLIVKKDINSPFHLDTEYPIRVKIYTIPSTNPVPGFKSNKIFLLINIHHIAGDGWSVEIFKKELVAFYESYITGDKNFCLPALQIQYKDYALWQKACLAGPVLKKQLLFWKRKLAGYQLLQIPADFARPILVNYKGAQKNFIISKEISAALRALAQLYGTTLYSVMLSSINIFLHKYTGQDDILIGSPIANRHHPKTENLIGFFVNMQINRTLLDNKQTFKELIQQVQQDQIQAQLNQDLPFEKLLDELGVERESSRHPIFQVTFGMNSFGSKRNVSKKKVSFNSFHTKGFYEVEKFDLSIQINDQRQELLVQVSYATSLFRKETIERMIDHYKYLLYQLTAAPELPYAGFSLLNPQAYKQIIHEWNILNKKHSKTNTICSLFHKQVEKRPAHTALVYGGQQLTYRQLDEISSQLARHIRSQHHTKTGRELTPDTCIALYIDRGLEIIISILAVLKAGAAYVPLDIHYPQERIDFILNDTQAKIVLAKRHLAKKNNIELPKNKIVYTDLTENFYETKSGTPLLQHNCITNLAYVIYTSGSTGKPKGVMIEHGSVINLVLSQKKMIKINYRSNILQYASFVFDASVWETFSALLHGARLFIVPDNIKQDAHLLCNYLAYYEINMALLPPVVVNMIPPTSLPHLQTLVVGGDICALDTMNKWSKARKLINAYGPTENTVITTMHTYEPGDRNTTIGKSIPNISVYVLDKNLVPVPVGITGELYIGGDGLARGYLNNPQLTAERFIANPFATETGTGKERLYRTGDLVRWLADGRLEFLGRNDDQVKIRGFRIELAEIEQALYSINGIQQCCVLAKERKTAAGTNRYLAAYYVWHSNADRCSQADIAKHLGQVLPDYMVPDAYVELSAFPLTVNGKLDRQALPDADFSAHQQAFTAPTNETEMRVCHIWQEVLGLKRVGITDNFFRIGGNSILAIQVSHRMSKILNRDVHVADIFRFTSIDKLLAYQHQLTELVRPYTTLNDESLNNLIFIHPGHAGSEAYQNLAEILSSNFNCIGIDNYNIHHQRKISSLNKLARYYLTVYEKKYFLSEPVNLLGWSLGGLIAMEMASILEEKGIRYITVFLLDTFLLNEKIVSPVKQKKSGGSIKENKIQRNDDMACQRQTDTLLKAEQVLACSPISSHLKHTQVVLFKATQEDKSTNAFHKNTDFKGLRELKKLTANNIDLVTKNMELINLDCHHGNMLQTNSTTISRYILSRNLVKESRT